MQNSSNASTEQKKIQKVNFKRATLPRNTWQSLAKTYGVAISKLRRAYKACKNAQSQSQPIDSRDIHSRLGTKKKPFALDKRSESVIKETVEYFADNNTLLTLKEVADLVQDYVGMLCFVQQKMIGFKNKRSSRNFILSFMKRNELSSQNVRQVEDQRINELSETNEVEHLSRVQAAMDGYHMKKARC